MGSDSFIWVFPAVLTSILISYISMPVIIQIAGLKNLIDKPDEVRKFHSGMIPTLGGIGIFAAFLISFSVWGGATNLTSYPFFVASLFMLFLIGIKDDILVISPAKKFIVQLLAAVEIVLGGKVYIDNLNGLFGVYELSWIVGVVLSVIIIVALINSYNMIDGIDGLAGGVGLVASVFLGIWFFGAGFHSLGMLSFVLSGALIGFLIFNFHPAKIFMGDTGAMAVGFILAFLSLQFISLNQTITESGWYIENATVMAVAVMIIPVVDTLRVSVIRLLSGHSPFTADHNHIHHKLIESNIPQHYVAISLWIANIIIVGLIYLMQNLEPSMLLCITLILGSVMLPSIKSIFKHLLGIYKDEDLAKPDLPSETGALKSDKKGLFGFKKLAEFIKESTT